MFFSKLTVAVSVVTWVGQRLARMVLHVLDPVLFPWEGWEKVTIKQNQVFDHNPLHHFFPSISVTKQAMIWLLLHHTGMVTNAICLNLLFLISPLLGIKLRRERNAGRNYSCVVLKWEFFIKMRVNCFAPSFLQKRGVLEWGWLQAGSSHFNKKISL